MNNGTRFLFALPALVSGLAVAWAIAAQHQLLPGPRDLLGLVQQVTCGLPSTGAQNTGLKL